MQYDEFLTRVAEDDGALDRGHADQATMAVLDLLGERLAGQEPSNLAAQLPREMKDPLTRRVGAAESFDVDEFFRRLAEREGRGCDPEQAREHAQSVIKTLSSFVSAGELDDLRSQLPAGYAVLFQ